jgi:hypothetical protein
MEGFQGPLPLAGIQGAAPLGGVQGQSPWPFFRSPDYPGSLRWPVDNVTLFDLGSAVGRRAVFGAVSDEFSIKVVAEQDAALAEVAALRGSTSWALTSPLRALKRFGVRLTRKS